MEETKEKVFDKSVNSYLIFCFIAQFANGIISFVLPLYILEIYESVFLYGLFLTIYYSSLVVIPVFFGPILEKKDKKKVCATCMFIFTFIYLICFLLCLTKLISVLIMAFSIAVISGMAFTIFTIASHSLLLDVVEKDKLQKVYPILTAVENTSAISQVIGLVIYRIIGLEMLFAFAALAYLIAFIFANLISVKVVNVPTIENKGYFDNFKYGLKYLKNKKVLLLTVIFIFFSYFNVGTRHVTWLPFFKANVENGYFWYFVTMATFSTGLVNSSILLTIKKIKKENRLKVFYVCVIVSAISEIMILFTTNILSAVLGYIAGLGLGISNNVRSVSIFEGINPEVKTRFIGIYDTILNGGYVIGMFFATVLSNYISLKFISTISKVMILVVILYLIIFRKETMRHFND